jgi:hypothetical protein
LTIQNENGGTGGIVTNSGALAVDSGGNTLHLVGGSLSNFSGGTLTGGYYLVAGTNANPGTLQIDALGTAGGEIVTNAATIVLSGKGSNLEDANGNNALSNLATNTGSLIIENGRNFTTSGSFTNNGTLDVGNNSTFSTPGAGNRFDNAGTVDIVSNGTLTARGYNQSAGTTTVDGMLTAKGGSGNVRITGGTVLGVGVIDGNVYVRGTGILQPGDAGSTGVMTTTGNYSSKGTLDEDLAGLTAGTQYGQLSVGGTSTLLSGSTLDVNEIDGFEAVSGDEFTILTAAGGESGTFTNLNFSDAPLPTGDYWWVSYGPNQIDLHVATPEPPVWMLLAVGLIIFVAYGMKKNLRSAKLSA